MYLKQCLLFYIFLLIKTNANGMFSKFFRTEERLNYLIQIGVKIYEGGEVYILQDHKIKDTEFEKDSIIFIEDILKVYNGIDVKYIEGGKIKFTKDCSLGKKGEERNILELIKELNKNNKRWLMPNEEQGDNHYLKLNIDGHAMAILINNFGEEKGRCNLFRLYFL